jgi:hypothetical protein
MLSLQYISNTDRRKFNIHCTVVQVSAPSAEALHLHPWLLRCDPFPLQKVFMSGRLWRAGKRLEFRYASDDFGKDLRILPPWRAGGDQSPDSRPDAQTLRRWQPPGNPRIIIVKRRKHPSR